jgi:hypothetical protein
MIHQDMIAFYLKKKGAQITGATMDPDIRLTILSARATQCMRGV